MIVIINIYLAFKSSYCFGLFWIILRTICWRTVSTDFWVKNLGGCTKALFAEDLCMGKLGGEACVLHCVYLFCLLFVYLLFVCIFAFYLL